MGDITGLDGVGLPVVQACRPDARSNAVTQGKGRTLPEAAIGAVLECLEMAAGEALEFCDAAGACGPWHACAPDGVNWPDAGTRWVMGWDIRADRPCPVPAALVCTDFSSGCWAEAAPVLRSSIGLGAGADLAEAAWHGLQECVEADARIRFQAAPDAQQDAARLPFDIIADRSTFALIVQAGLRAAAWQMPAPPGLVAVAVRVMEDPARNAALPLPAEGFAARPDLADAVEAAAMEALQARLAVISGAREDITAAFYRSSVPGEVLQWEWQRLARVSHGAPVSPAPAPAPCPVLANLPAGPVVVVPLLHDAHVPLDIVRVVVPGLLSDPERL